MRRAAGRRALYHDYICHYEHRSYEGDVSLCDRRLLSACDSPAAPCDLYSQTIRENFLRSRAEHGAEVLRRTMKGFAILELICVNLFLYPWRKEIRTLKKFTGNFIYFVEPVVNKDTVRQILQRVGYSIITETEYIIGGVINTEAAKQTAFELFLARIQCEELILLINEGRTDCVNLFINGHSVEAKNKSDNSGLAVKSNSKVISEDINTLNVKSKDSEKMSNKDSKKHSDKVDPSATLGNNEESIYEASTKHLNYIYNKDSDEFLNMYSDLNLAQKPIFPLHNRQMNIKLKEPREEWIQLEYKEPNSVKAHNPESFAPVSELDISQSREPIKQPIAEQKCENVRLVDSKSDAKRPLMLSNSPAEFNISQKQGPSERSVNKLKMENMAFEALTYPVEDTFPPDAVDVTESCDMRQSKPKQGFHSSKPLVDGASVLSTSGFTITNQSPCAENSNNLREPPSSTYIPPVVAERQCLKITDLQPEENHFQPPSLPGNADLLSETLYTMNEDSKEPFVMISRIDHLQH